MQILGLDGCKAGWIAVAEIDGELRVELWPDLKPLFEQAWNCACVDIPIGLKFGNGRRDCDQAARDLLGKQRSSIFFAPPRQHLGATEYQHVRTQGMSLQTFYLLPKIRAMDSLIEATDQTWLKEAHPELSYRVRATEPLEKKKKALGREQRQEILRSLGSKFELPEWQARFLRKDVALDDLLDAAVLLEVARNQADGTGLSVRDESRDPTGLQMQICY